jgi:hypothetical protein
MYLVFGQASCSYLSLPYRTHVRCLVADMVDGLRDLHAPAMQTDDR